MIFAMRYTPGARHDQSRVSYRLCLGGLHGRLFHRHVDGRLPELELRAMSGELKAQLPEGDTTIVATTRHIYRLDDDGKFEVMEFITMPPAENGEEAP